MSSVAAIQSAESITASPAASNARYAKLFWQILAAHVVVWTVLPLLVHRNLPLDAIEMSYWGSQWELGYHKHPPLPAWMMQAVGNLTGGAAWGHYLTVQLCVAACFWAAWRLGREMLPVRYALAGAAVLECCYYYNYEATTLNNNTAMYPFWALAILMLYWAIRRGGNQYWLAAGAMLGLGLLCKYVTGILALNMLAFGLLHPSVRRKWLTPGPWLMLLAASLVFGPHLVWAVENDFPPLQYAMYRTEGGGVWYGRLVYPLMFAGAQLLAITPVMLALNPLTGWRWRRRPLESTDHFNRDFLLAMSVGPLVFHLLLSFALNINLKSMYGSQLFTFVGVTLLFFLQRHGQQQQWRQVYLRIALTAAILAGVLLGRNLIAPWVGEVHRIHFPGHQLASEVEAYWGRHKTESLRVVAGDGWLSGNVAHYGEQHPKVFGIPGYQQPPVGDTECGWMNDQQFHCEGGVVMWYANEHDTPPAKLLKRYPQLEAIETIEVQPQTLTKVPPIRISVAIVPSRGEHPRHVASQPESPASTTVSR